MRYAVVVEKAEGNYSAYVPDLPGCVATGATPDEAGRRIREAIRLHLDGLREDGRPCSRVAFSGWLGGRTQLRCIFRSLSNGLHQMQYPKVWDYVW